MKRILLSSAAVISFAGVAAADGHLGVTFSGSAELGFNDTAYSTTTSVDADDTDALGVAVVDTSDSGFYTDLEVTVGLAAELDNGLTAAASIDLEDLADGAEATEYELSLTSADSGLYYGDTNFAAQNVWVSAGDMAADNFSEADGEEVLRAEIGFGNIAAQMSYANGGGVTGADTLEQLSLGVSADFGNVNVVAAYQDAASAAFTAARSGTVDTDLDGLFTEAANGDFNGAEVFGLSVGTSFAGADVRLAYADNGTEDSTGISVSYPVGPVTVDASYAVNSASDDTWDLAVAYENGPIAVTVSTDEGDDWGLEGSYDVGNGLMVYAGVVDAGEDFYIGGEYDLGSGAALLVSFADDGDNDEAAGDDDIGAQDYMVGTTVELSFEF